jgi:hypothetical protein
LNLIGQLGADTGPYTIDTITVPYDNPSQSYMRLSGHDFFADGRAAVCTLDGDVWIVSGIDAPGALRMLGKRIIQLHLKDVDAKKVDTAFGKGIVDIKGCLVAFKELGFKGVLTFEYDVKPKDPNEARLEFVPQLAGDVAFFDQCARELSGK